MALTEEEKARVRYHLGYLDVAPVVSIQLGFPRASQPMFLVEAAMENILETAIGIVRRHVAELDGIEDQISDARRRMKAEKLGEITLRADETDALEREYARWARRLADILGVPLNIYAERFRAGGGAPLSVPVVQ